jgi:hypothetical protein
MGSPGHEHIDSDLFLGHCKNHTNYFLLNNLLTLNSLY